MRPTARKTLIYSSVIIASLVAGGLAGEMVNKVIQQHHAAEKLALRNQLNDAAVAHFCAIRTGDTLADHTFQTLDHQAMRLSEALVDGAVLCLVDPNCDQCIEEMMRLGKENLQAQDQRHFAFISSGTREALQVLRDNSGLGSLFLCDTDHAWLASYNISLYPLNLVVGPDRVVRQIIAGALSPAETEALVKRFAQ